MVIVLGLSRDSFMHYDDFGFWAVGLKADRHVPCNLAFIAHVPAVNEGMWRLHNKELPVDRDDLTIWKPIV